MVSPCGELRLDATTDELMADPDTVALIRTLMTEVAAVNMRVSTGLAVVPTASSHSQK